MNPLTYGQSKCQTFQEFEKNGNSVQELDSLYPSGVSIDTNIAVFKKEEEKKYLKVWGGLFYDLDSFLFDNGFIKHYRLGIKGDKDFAQCGSTIFFPK